MDNISEYRNFFPELIVEGHCIMVDIPQREKILEFVKNIPTECVYEEPGENYGKETNPHVTIMYGLSESEEKRVKELLTKVPKNIVAELGKISKFENKGTPFDVLKIEVKSPHLNKIHEMILNNFDNNYQWPEYNPHVTLAYVKKGTCNEFVGDTRFEGTKFAFENFTYSNGIREQNHKVNMKEYAIGQGGGYGGQPGGSIAATGWAGTYSSPQTSNRLNLHPDTGVTSYMQGNTIVRNALPDTILPQDLEGTPYDPDEIRLGLRSEMKKQEFPDKTKAKDTVLQNLAKNPKFYSDLLQYMNSDKGNIMETDIKQTDEAKGKDGFSSYKKKIAQQFAKGMDHEKEHTKDPKLAAKIAVDHIRGDQAYYDKLEAAGLEECGCDDMAPEENVAVIKIDPATQTGTVGGMVSGNQQKPLASSGLGVGGQPKPLTSTNIEAPDSKKVGPNTVATSKTPPVVSGSDPLDYFASKIQSALE